MTPHPYFSEQVAADHRHALHEQAHIHRLLKQPPSTETRRLRRSISQATRRWLGTVGLPRATRATPVAAQPLTPDSTN